MQHATLYQSSTCHKTDHKVRLWWVHMCMLIIACTSQCVLAMARTCMHNSTVTRSHEGFGRVDVH